MGTISLGSRSLGTVLRVQSPPSLFQIDPVEEACETAPFCIGAVVTFKTHVYFDEYLKYKAGKIAGYCTVVGFHEHVPTFYCTLSIFWDYEKKCSKHPEQVVAEAAFAGKGLLEARNRYHCRHVSRYRIQRLHQGRVRPHYCHDFIYKEGQHRSRVCYCWNAYCSIRREFVFLCMNYSDRFRHDIFYLLLRIYKLKL